MNDVCTDNSRYSLRKPAGFLLLLLIANACLEPYLPPRIQADAGFLVVDGFLVPNDTTVIRLTRTRGLASTDPSTVEPGANVTIEAENGLTYPLSEPEQGTYRLLPLDLDGTLAYRLRIRTQDNKEYASEFVDLRRAALLDSTTWEEDSTREFIQFNIYAHDPTNQALYYLWTYDETWQYTSLTTSQLYYENGEMLYRNLATEIYYCWKTVKTNNVYVNATTALSADRVNDFTLFRLPQHDRKLYFGYSILVRQYTLTEAAYNYWTITKRNSEGLGTLFDPLPAQPTSNFRCLTHPAEPVVGYFSASTVSTGRVLFSRQKIRGPSRPYGPSGYEQCELMLVRPWEVSDERLAGMLVHQREYDPATGEFIGFSVAKEECMDCRKKGGTNQKPDYWF